jgi:dihydrodipicolinate reductase (EC 1.3.1.26)
MNIALIGYGKMGHEIEKIALQRGHNIVSIIDMNNLEEFNSPAFKSADVAIEFSTPDSAIQNYRKCFEVGVAVVAGTTGWLEHLDEVKRACAEQGQNFLLCF